MRTFAPLLVATLLACCGCRSAPDSRLNALSQIEPAVSALGGASRDAGARNNPTAGSEIRLVSGESQIGPETRAVATEPLPTPREEIAARPAPAMTLAAAVELSLQRNPELAVVRAREGVAHAAYHVAEVYPFNPNAEVEAVPFAQDIDGNSLAVKNTVSLMQTLELAHQSSYRRAGADAAWRQVRWEIVSAELNTVAQTERLYATAIYQRALRDLAADEAALDERLLGVVRRSFDANLTTVDKVSLAQVTARAARQQADLAVTQYQAALFALRGQLNLAPGEELRLSDDLAHWRWLPATASMAGRSEVGRDAYSDRQAIVALVAGRPDLLAAQASLQSAQAAAGLAEANKIQNITVGPTYERDESGTVFVGVRAGMPLPVWDTGGPLANQRRAEARLQRVTWQQLEARAVVEAEAAIARYERARLLVSGFGADYTQKLDAELRAMEDQYKAGQTDIFSVYATRSGINQQRRAYLDLLNEAAQAAAGVTQATGLLPDTFIERPAAEAPPPDGQLPSP